MANPYEQFIDAEPAANPYLDIVPAPPKRESGPTEIESAARGVAQGATFGFADEITGAAKALGIEPMKLAAALATGAGALGSYVGQQLGITTRDKSADQVVEDYRRERDTQREKNAAAEKANRKSYIAGQIGGGLATALVPGGAPATLGRAAAVGAGYGATAGLGGSDADLTRGEVGGAAADVLVGAGAGAVGGAVGHGVAKGAGAIRNKLSPTRRLVTEAADRLNEAADVAADGQPVEEMLRAAEGLEAKASSKLGRKFEFSPGQATGQRSLLLKESAAAQVPETMDAAQKLQGGRLKDLGDMLNMFTSAVASKPDRLGNAQVGGNVAKALTGYVDELAAQRTAVAAPLFEAAEKSSEGLKLIPTSSLRQAIGTFEDEVGVKVAPLFHKVLERADDAGAVSIGDAQRLLSYLSRGDAPVASGLTERQSARAARMLRSALDADLDAATRVSDEVGPSLAKAGAESVAKLREARSVWATYSQQIDDVMSKTARKVLGLAEDEADDAIVSKLTAAGTTPQQVTGIMTTLGKAGVNGKAAAQDLRAQVMTNLFAEAGAAPTDAAFKSSVAGEGLSAAKLRTLLKNHGPKIKALFADEPKAFAELQDLYNITERLALTPGLRGSQTVPLQESLLAMAKANKGTIGEALSSAVRKAVEKRVLGEEAQARALATPEGISAWRTLMRSTMSGEGPKTAQAITQALGRLTSVLAMTGEGAAPRAASAPMPGELRAAADEGAR